MRKIIVGSRKSKLALTQTNWFIEQMKKAGAPFEFEVKEIVTKGDRILDVQLSKVGGKGLFVKEIEQALMDKEIDFAVHSMKDMPAVLPDGLVIGCIPKEKTHVMPSSRKVM
ncbi:Porphobilinogen deaminase OS=Ureibacillus acetophenoni OX=614649 GN=hemC PE=3 SV=1 [Ureibacillus acetophenoni]